MAKRRRWEPPPVAIERPSGLFSPGKLYLLATCLLAAAGLNGCFLFHVRVEPFTYTVSDLSGEEISRIGVKADALYRVPPPRTVENVVESYRLALSSISPFNGHRGIWQAARAASWLAANHPDAERREFFALQGVAAGREAVRLSPGQVESHYYFALAMGRLSDLKKTPQFIEEMAEEAGKALKIDERFDRAGPHRFLGLLHLGTVNQPMIGFGDLDLALEHLGRAVELFPGDAENRVALAEALIEDESYQEARRELDAALASKPSPGLEDEHSACLRDAMRLKKEIQGK